MDCGRRGGKGAIVVQDDCHPVPRRQRQSGPDRRISRGLAGARPSIVNYRGHPERSEAKSKEPEAGPFRPCNGIRRLALGMTALFGAGNSAVEKPIKRRHLGNRESGDGCRDEQEGVPD